eukprot:g870.t1
MSGAKPFCPSGSGASRKQENSPPGTLSSPPQTCMQTYHFYPQHAPHSLCGLSRASKSKKEISCANNPLRFCNVRFEELRNSWAGLDISMCDR